MGAQKTKTVTAGKLGIVVSNSRVRQHALRIKLFGLLGIIVLIFLVFGGVAALRHHTHKDVTGVAGRPVPAKQSVSDQAIGLSAIGKSEQAQALLDKQLHGATKSQQADIYTQKASIAYDNQNYVNALQYAQKSEALKPTAASAQMIAESSEVLGDKSTALEYYKKQLKRMGTPVVRGATDGLKAKIKALGGK